MKPNLNPKALATGLFKIADENEMLDDV